MRQRKIKNIDEKLLAYGPLLAEAAEENRGRWREAFGAEGGRLYMEIGCGKGQFITRCAARDPACPAAPASWAPPERRPPGGAPRPGRAAPCA